MRKIKILFLILLGIFGLNSCVALGTATAVYFGATLLAYTCADSPNSGICETLSDTPEKEAKREQRKKIKEEEYIRTIILEERKNVEVIEGIKILMPKRLEFRKNKSSEENDNGHIIARLYDKEKRKYFPQNLYIIKRNKKNFEKIIKNGKDEEYEEYYKEKRKKSTEKLIIEYEKKASEEDNSELKQHYEKRLEEFKKDNEEGFNIKYKIEKISENVYKINEKEGEWDRVVYIKILKDGVYIIGDERSKDIFIALFGE